MTSKKNIFNMSSENNETFNWHQNTWKVIEKYLLKDSGTHLVHHQIHSYNEFIQKNLHEIIYGYNPIHLSYEYMPDHSCHQYELFIKFESASMTAAMIHENDGSMKLMLPNDARKRNFTYASDLSVNLSIHYLQRDPETAAIILDKTSRVDKISLGKVPIMLHSCLCLLNKKDIRQTEECLYDKGGYFIINGSEKVIVSQERRAENKIFVCKNNKAQSKYGIVCEINSMVTAKVVIPKTIQIKMMSKSVNTKGKIIKISISHVRQDLPLLIVFKALGVVSDLNILQYILFEKDIDIQPVASDENIYRRILDSHYSGLKNIFSFNNTARDMVCELASYLQKRGALDANNIR